MSALEAALRAIAAELERQRVPWALVGGLAVTARAEPRTTRDVDVASARAALALVTARGFHRGKDLEAELERALADR